jgi:hypothetical protein
MNNYFYHDGFREFGPFTAQELLDKKIRPDYKLRLDGQDELKMAKEVEEVATLFKSRQQQSSTPILQTYATSLPSAQQSFERDFSFEEQQNTTNRAMAQSPADWRQAVLIGALGFWLFDIFLKWILDLLQVEFWQGPGKIINVFMGLIFSFIPVLIAISIKNVNYRIIAMVLASLITLSLIFSNIMWAFNWSFY